MSDSAQSAPASWPSGPISIAVADPAPLGLAGFGLTTFILSAHNANWAPDLIWVGLAMFYGGLAQLLAGMQEFRNKNTFGATAFSTYGAFWLAYATFVIMILAHAVPASVNTDFASGWFVASFAIFNLYMTFWSTRINKAIFAVFFTLQVTEMVLAAGNFLAGHGYVAGTDLIHVAGYAGIVTAACAWYASAAGVINSMTQHPVLPVGTPMWGGPARAARRERPSAIGATPVPQH